MLSRSLAQQQNKIAQVFQSIQQCINSYSTKSKDLIKHQKARFISLNEIDLQTLTLRISLSRN